MGAQGAGAERKNRPFVCATDVFVATQGQEARRAYIITMIAFLHQVTASLLLSPTPRSSPVRMMAGGWTKMDAPLMHEVEEMLKPGAVLVAAPGSFDHYFMESLVLLLETTPEDGSRGVLLNHEMPWQVEDMGNDKLSECFGQNAVFLGGERGRDTMLMVHSQSDLPGSSPLGPVHMGGVAAAMQRVASGERSAEDFKFFYKSSEWLPGALEKEVCNGLWRVVDLDPSVLLAQRGPKRKPPTQIQPHAACV